MKTDRFKFRAWDKCWKQMVYPDIIYHNINLGCTIYSAFKPSEGNNYFPLQENLTLMQCTGLKDVKGKLIYEGDLVMLKHWKSADLFNYSKPFEVCWEYGQVNFKQGDYNNFIGSLVGKLDIKIISNIYETVQK